MMKIINKNLYKKKDVNTFSQEKYEKMLELVLKTAQDEFKQVTYDLPNYQKNILRNYQWLSTVILAAECVLFLHVIDKDKGFWLLPWEVRPTLMFYTWAFLAALAALGVFVLGLDTLRGRGVTWCPTLRKYAELTQIAYEEANDEMREKTPPGTLRTTMINDLEIAIEDHRIKASSVGLKLRKMSWGLLLSLCFTGVALFPNITLDANQAQEEVSEMSEPKTPPPPPPSSVARPPVASGQSDTRPVMITNEKTGPFVTRDRDTHPTKKK